MAKLTEEYDSEFVEAVSKLIDEFSTDLPKSSAIVGKNVLKKEKKTRAPTAYNIFLKETMAEMKSVGTELKGKALMMAAVEEWNKLKEKKSSDEDKPENTKSRKNGILAAIADSDEEEETQDNGFGGASSDEEELPQPVKGGKKGKK